MNDGAVIARQSFLYFYDSISCSLLVCKRFNWWFCWPGRTNTEAHEHYAQAPLNGFMLLLSTRHSHMASYEKECMVQWLSILCHMVIWALWVMNSVLPVDMNTHPVAEEEPQREGTRIMLCGILLFSYLLFCAASMHFCTLTCAHVSVCFCIYCSVWRIMLWLNTWENSSKWSNILIVDNIHALY